MSITGTEMCIRDRACMSLFDILNGAGLGSTLGSLADKAKSTASDLGKNAPGGLGGLLGAGALGALLGTVLSKDVLKNAALVGAGAVAWNFYQKWSQNKADVYKRQAYTMAEPDSVYPSHSPFVAENNERMRDGRGCLQ